jgi:hypothetical protein
VEPVGDAMVDRDIEADDRPPSPRATTMAKKFELVIISPRFDYAPLAPETAERVRSTATRIRAKIKKTLEDIIGIGAELHAVKDSLDHGQFGRWLRAEFGWTERMARNFMAVAERFGKTEMISDLQIQPTAAYLLAAPSAPDEARQAALERAASGEQITAKVAKEILTRTRKRLRRKPKAPSAEKLVQRLAATVDRFKERWNPQESAEMVRELRKIADALDREWRKKSG